MISKIQKIESKPKRSIGIKQITKAIDQVKSGIYDF